MKPPSKRVLQTILAALNSDNDADTEVFEAEAWVEAALNDLNARARPRRARVIVESCPGDACGNTRKLPDGSKCPGCRACA